MDSDATRYSESSGPPTDSRSSGLMSPNNTDSDTELSQSVVGQNQIEQRQFSRNSPGPGALDMSHMAATLPEYGYRQMPQTMYQQPYPNQVQHAQMSYLYQNPQYQGPMQGSYPANFPSHMHPQAFQSQQRTHPHYTIPSSAGIGQPMFHGQPYYTQQSPISPSAQSSFTSVSPAQSYGHSHAAMYGPRVMNQYYGPQIRIDNFAHTTPTNQTYDTTYYQNDSLGVRRTSSSTSLNVSSALRGPPRKPRQSGHALWVGNLPPGTNIMDLKDHFSKEATDHIESVFLISKSNCAFVNYKSESSCTAAMARFHDSRFNGVRLVCRLRRGSSPTTTTPNNTAITTGSEPNVVTTDSATQMASEDVNQDEGKVPAQTTSKVSERYFIIKSLTIEDLERSVHNGIWATQSHNEELLNKAYQTAESVYLIFSANKSGEYFGYARMDTAIDDESASAIDSDTVEKKIAEQRIGAVKAEIPLTIPTPATATAPKGYIIDDSARGTIFWEAETTVPHAETGTSDASPEDADSGDDTNEVQEQSQARLTSTTQNATFGKPFKITWMSTERLPFYRTRGLRNPWNTNREVKIARDGTELEPNVGRKLVSMFHMGLETGRQQPLQYPGMIPQMPGQSPAYRPF